VHLDRLLWTDNDINEAGEVAASRLGAFYYNGLTTTQLDVVQTPEGPVRAAGLFSINNNSVMVGWCSLTSNITAEGLRAFMYDGKSGAARAWGLPAGTPHQSVAKAINDTGVVAGEWESPNGLRAAQFALDGRIVDLGTLGGNASAATGINKWGEIVGYSKNAADLNRAFLIRRGMVDLGVLGGNESRATRINNLGDVVGAAQTASGAWRACLWSGGKAVDLFDAGDLDGDGTVAVAINDLGVILMNGPYFSVYVKYPGQKPQNLRPLVKFAAIDYRIGVHQEEDYVEQTWDINNSGMILVENYHPVYHGGVAYTAILRPGVVTPIISGGQWTLSISAPPGFEVGWTDRRIFSSGRR
jgi:probable HAF family extracellular repeat protein